MGPLARLARQNSIISLSLAADCGADCSWSVKRGPACGRYRRTVKALQNLAWGSQSWLQAGFLAGRDALKASQTDPLPTILRQNGMILRQNGLNETVCHYQTGGNSAKPRR